MPTFTFTSPDGKSYDVEGPEGATQEQAFAMLQQQLGAQPTAGPPKVPGGDSYFKRRTRQAQLMGLQAAKPMSGLMAAAAEALPEGSAPREYFQSLPLRVSETEQNLKTEAEQGNPEGLDYGDFEEFATQAVMTLPLGGAKVAAGAPAILNRAFSGAATGAALAGTNDAGAGANAAVGGTVNALLPPALRGTAKFLSPKTQTEAGKLAAEGVKLTPGMAFGGAAKAVEDKLTSVPFVGDLIKGGQRAAMESYNTVEINRALAPIGAKVGGSGRAAIAEAQDVVDDAYRTLLPSLRVQFDDQFGMSVANLRNLAQGLPDKQREIFNRALDKDVLGRFTEYGTGSGQTAQDVLSRLSQRIKDAFRAGDADSRDLANALKELRSQLYGALDRSNPQMAGELARLTQTRAMLGRIEAAAESAGSKDGVFSPTAMMAAVRGNARRAGNRRAVAGGRALGQEFAERAESVMGQKVADSGTAGRALLAASPALATPAAPSVGVPALIASLPYLPGGRQIFNYLAFARPPGMNALARGINTAAPAVAPVALPASNALFYGGN